MPARFLTYQCRSCPRQGRRYRMIAHVLKEHIPRDQAPYYCTLCNFRCQEAKTLEEHITDYAPHQREEAKQGVPDYGLVLKFSDNPAKVEDHFYVVGGDSGPRDEGKATGASTELINRRGRILPRWIVDRNIPQPPTVVRQSAPPAAPEYVPTPVANLSVPSILGFDALLDDSPFTEDESPASLTAEATGAFPSMAASQTQQGRVAMYPSPSLQVPPRVTPRQTPATVQKQPLSTQMVFTPKVATVTSSSRPTPVLDELPGFDLLPTVADRSDPLLREEENSRKRKPEEDVSPNPKTDLGSANIIAEAVTKGTSKICQALEDQHASIKALQQAMTRQADESARLERRVNAILRFLENNFSTARRDDSPKIKSAVFKRR